MNNSPFCIRHPDEVNILATLRESRLPTTGEELRDEIHQKATEHKNAMEAGSWWHSIDLGNGQVTSGAHSLEELRGIYAGFNLPNDLRGKRFLDVGCWDGFYSFEAERHGAEVVALDCWRPENFFIAHHALQSKVEFHEMSVYELSRDRLGSFDIVLFHGVLYHLRHPLLGLECVCDVTDEFTVIESHVVDNLIDLPRPVMEFYELDELGGQPDNWWGPNSECLVRMTRSAGFARTEVVHSEPTRVTIKAYRRWADTPLHRSPSLNIRSVFNAVTFDQQVPNRGRRALLGLYVEGLPERVTGEELRLEVGGFGINPYFVHSTGNPQLPTLKQINTRLPPGLKPGMAAVRLLYQGRQSNEQEIRVVEGTEW